MREERKNKTRNEIIVNLKIIVYNQLNLKYVRLDIRINYTTLFTTILKLLYSNSVDFSLGTYKRNHVQVYLRE